MTFTISVRDLCITHLNGAWLENPIKLESSPIQETILDIISEHQLDVKNKNSLIKLHLPEEGNFSENDEVDLSYDILVGAKDD